MKRHETRGFFVRFRVASWIVLFILTKGALIETDPLLTAVGSLDRKVGARLFGARLFSLAIKRAQ